MIWPKGTHGRNIPLRVLGVSGGLDRPYQNRPHLFPRNWAHDAAGVLVQDGRVTEAIEEERLNRIKHTSKGASSAISFCLARHGMRLNDLDYLALYGTETIFNGFIRSVHCSNPDISCSFTVRQMVHELLVDELGDDIDDTKLVFVPHHLCHVVSAYFHSGYGDALVITLDGGGDGLSGTVSYVSSGSMTLLQTSPISKSLGVFYDAVIAIIGYSFTEEYKVMGLAPYGNPARFRQPFQNMYALLPRGDFILRWDLIGVLNELIPARKRSDPLEQIHADVAAALQETLEDIVLHVARHFRDLTGNTRLCLSGGVAHNCSMNGKLLYAKLFEDIFVHPASHDAGCAIGAGLYPYLLAHGFHVDGEPPDSTIPVVVSSSPSCIGDELRTVYWGSDIGSDEAIQAELTEWDEFVRFEAVEDIATRTAALLSEGAVVGWVQGRSEFGPRALGNRSIIADPRKAENKDIVNAMIKKREAYRPFAPAILEEFVHEYFDLPGEKSRFPFMTFVVRVKTEKQDLLRATTHVDGTARVQTVSREDNARFWELIDAFRTITGVPVVLNTSFNNNQEPIVDSVDDAVVTFLSTGLTHLVLGNTLVSKKPLQQVAYTKLYPSLPRHMQLMSRRSHARIGIQTEYFLANTYDDHIIPISERAYRTLSESDGSRSIGELITPALHGEPDVLLNELYNLWCVRALKCSVRVLNSGDSNSCYRREGRCPPAADPVDGASPTVRVPHR
jgi:carbamoyltransferase